MNCKNLKQKFDRTLFCKKKNKTITFKDCNSCNFKEYKMQQCSLNKSKTQTNKKMRVKSSELAKLEKNRFSIIYKDLTKCCVPHCNCTTNIQKNEVYEGAYRQRSIKYGMITPFCEYHHRLFHNDILFNLKFKVIFQIEFMKTHNLEDFINIFGQNYIYKLQKITKIFQQK